MCMGKEGSIRVLMSPYVCIYRREWLGPTGKEWAYLGTDGSFIVTMGLYSD